VRELRIGALDFPHQFQSIRQASYERSLVSRGSEAVDVILQSRHQRRIKHSPLLRVRARELDRGFQCVGNLWLVALLSVNRELKLADKVSVLLFPWSTPPPSQAPNFGSYVGGINCTPSRWLRTRRYLPSL
jgi:hypothetical protein